VNESGTRKRRPRLRERTVYAVWELTLRCNLLCIHCGSRAGKARERELDTSEALDLVRQLGEVGVDEITLIGGEAYLRRDWFEIAQAIAARGMVCTMTTGGYGLSPALARRIYDAGIHTVSVSIDGMEESHDRQRGRAGSWRACLRALELLHEAGVQTGCNTQVNRLSAPDLPALADLLCATDIVGWQVQFTNPMGNAVDNSWLILQPAELLDVYPVIAGLAKRIRKAGIRMAAGSNLYYYGPFAKTILQERLGRSGRYEGCLAGIQVIGIEADGKIKGDPSLPTSRYVGGNIREQTLPEILMTDELTFNLADDPGLWGFCGTCKHASACRGGCAWTADVFFGRRGNNPYCHHRALTLARRGLRERVVKVREASPDPFAHGEFAIVEEPLDAPWPDGDSHHLTRERMRSPLTAADARGAAARATG
jgi:radical SAM protein with 4Fe4S-binding SPASM domain